MRPVQTPSRRPTALRGKQEPRSLSIKLVLLCWLLPPQELRLKQREQAVSEKLKAELNWYEQQKHKLRDKSTDDNYPQVKKARSAISRLKREQVRIKYLFLMVTQPICLKVIAFYGGLNHLQAMIRKQLQEQKMDSKAVSLSQFLC